MDKMLTTLSTALMVPALRADLLTSRMKSSRLSPMVAVATQAATEVVVVATNSESFCSQLNVKPCYFPLSLE